MLKRLSKFMPYQYAMLLCVLVFSALISAFALLVTYRFNAIGFLNVLNYDALLQSLVALNSGILIAIFVALFFGNEESMTILKKFRPASRQTVIVLLINSFLVGAATLFAMNFPDQPSPSQITYLTWTNIISCTVAIVATVANAYEVFQLVKLSLRKDNQDKLPPTRVIK